MAQDTEHRHWEGDLARDINWLDRTKVVEILEGYGFACYDSESTDSLREALRINVDDGTIPRSAIE